MSDAAAAAPAAVGAVPSGASPWTLARRRLWRNRVAMVMLGIFVVIVVVCLAAPLYASDVAHTDPFLADPNATTIVHGKRVLVVPNSTAGLGLGANPIGPTWDPHHYFLGADKQGRDVAARLLYGGRNSLLIGFVAALITCLRGDVDRDRRRLLRRRGRRGHLEAARDRLGVSRLPVRDLPLDDPDHAGPRLRPGPDRVGEPGAANRDHRHRLHPVRRATDPGRGSLVASARVRGGRHRPRRVEDAAAAEGHPPQRRHDGDRFLPARHGARNADRGGTVVPERSASRPPTRVGERSSRTAPS